MKIRTLLVASFCLNLALFGTIWMVRPTPPAESETADQRATAAPRSGAPQPANRPQGGTTTMTVEGFPFDWSGVESEDFRQYIANMREIGVPEATIQDIVIAEINRIYASRIRALYPAPETFEYWKAPAGRGGRGGPGGGNVVPNTRDIDQQVRALENEKREVIRELLGISMQDALDQWNGRPSNQDYRLGFLTPEKRDQVTAMQDRFQTEQRNLWGDETLSNEERREKFMALRQAEQDELRTLLTPQEYEDYELRTSRTAERMRGTLGSFSPSEQEFREIFRLRSEYEQQFFGQDVDDATRQAAESALEQSLANSLGQDRYEEYKLSQDDRYRSIYDFAQRNELPAETARAIYDIQSVAEAERSQILSDQSLAPQDRELILAAMAEETAQVLQRTLGAELYDTYASRDGRWMARIGSADQGRRGGNFGGRGGMGGGQGGRGGGGFGGPGGRGGR